MKRNHPEEFGDGEGETPRKEFKTDNDESKASKEKKMHEQIKTENSQKKDEKGIDINSYLQDKNLQKLIQDFSQDPTRYKEYKKLQYQNTIYEIQDDLLIANMEDLSNDFIGRLQKIVQIQDVKVLTLIEVQCENQIFLTDHNDVTFVDCINGQCLIYNYDDYDKLPNIQQNMFFSRAQYNTAQQKFNPSFEKWPVGCICQRPLNPDLLYIQCEVCEIWVHITCAKVKQEELETVEYICDQCKQSGHSQKQ